MLNAIGNRKIRGGQLMPFPSVCDGIDNLNNCHQLSEQLDNLKTILKQHDMYETFYIVQPREQIIANIGTKKGRKVSPKVKDLFVDYHDVSAKEVGMSTLWYKKWGGGPWPKAITEDLTTSMQLLQTNMQASLHSAIKKTHDSFPPEFHGGPLLFTIAIQAIQASTDVSMKNLIEAIKVVKISKVPGEDVSIVVAKLRSGRSEERRVGKEC